MGESIFEGKLNRTVHMNWFFVLIFIRLVSSGLMLLRSHSFRIYPDSHACLSVPVSAIPQDRQFSKLKRRCSGLLNQVEIGTLDRDAFIYARCNTTY